MSANRRRRRLGNAILLSLAVIVTLGLTATEGDATPILTKGPAMAKGFCEYGPDQQKACGGGGLSGTQSGVQCKGNPVDC